MNFDDVKELIDIINVSDLTEFSLSMDNVQVKMSKNKGEVLQTPELSAPSITAAVPKQEAAAAPVKEKSVKPATAEKGTLVKAPIVGTLYLSPSPDKPNFVELGNGVKKGDILCIVEAMKIMNEIVSPEDGTIDEILSENQALVEYGQPLFRIV